MTLLIFNQQCQLFRAAFPHGDRAGKALLGADRAADAQGRVGVRMTLLIQLDRQVRAAGAVAAGSAQIVIEARRFS